MTKDGRPTLLHGRNAGGFSGARTGLPVRQHVLEPALMRRQAWQRRQAARLAQVILGGTLAIVSIAAVYYFNLLVELEQEVETAEAQIERELQRRADLIHNLLPAVFEYAALERQVFTEVAKIRSQLAGTGSGGSGLPLDQQGRLPGQGADPLGEVLERLLAVSEQYPDMKASAPFNLLMEKTVEIEDRLAAERKIYNDWVNVYTNALATFPSRYFAKAFGFEDRPLFTADPEAKERPRIERPTPAP